MYGVFKLISSKYPMLAEANIEHSCYFQSPAGCITVQDNTAGRTHKLLQSTQKRCHGAPPLPANAADD